jgi:hypothetical protein
MYVYFKPKPRVFIELSLSAVIGKTFDPDFMLTRGGNFVAKLIEKSELKFLNF